MRIQLNKDKEFVYYSAIFLLVCLIVVFVLPIVLVQPWICNYTNTGEIGDTIGGIAGPFIAIIAAYLTFIAFWVQYRANQKQREDIAMERFNANFYNLLNIHEEITNNLEFEYHQLTGVSITARGRSSFNAAFNESREIASDNAQFTGIRQLLFCKGLAAYMYSNTPSYFDHYFRCMYRIIKFVDETKVLVGKNKDIDFQNRYEYVAILRSKLSRYELVWLFYNGLTYGKDKFKPLIEKYSLLKNLRTELLVRKNDVNDYAERAFKSFVG